MKKYFCSCIEEKRREREVEEGEMNDEFYEKINEYPLATCCFIDLIKYSFGLI